jgi:hypothetical protein
MATYYARKSGNINAADVWATTPSGTASNLFPTFTNADVLMANSFTITVNVSATVAQVRNDTTGGATVSGSFSLAEGVTLTANSFTGNTNVSCISITGSVSASLVGNVAATQSAVVNGAGLNHTSTGTLTVTGNINASTTSGGQANHGVFFNQAGLGALIVTGNVTGGAQGSGSGTTGICLNNAGTVTVTGNVTGGTHSTGAGITNANGTITINGQCRGGTQASGVVNSSTGTIRATRAVGNAYGPGNTAGLAAAPGASNVGVGVIEIEQLEYGTFGQSPTSGTGIRLKKASSNVAVFNYCDTAGAKTLIDATTYAAMPAASDVRSGVSYASGALTGTCAVPAAGSVSLGVAVDNTTGAAFVTGSDIATAVWGAATRTITGGLVDTATTLTNAPTVPSVVQIRQEMDSNSTKLANLDATVSSRLSPSGTLATVTTLTNAPTVPTAAEIATAVEGSLLNEADGQAVLNAIVAAIGNQNLSEVSLVAAVRADLERTGGKLDSIPTTAAPTAAQNASAVWGATTKEITGGTVTNLTNAPASVTPSDIWSHSTRTLTSASGPTATEIRQEMDSNSTQLSAIKAKTDNLPADPADQSLLEAAIAGVTAPTAGQVASQVRTELSSELAKVAALNTERLANVATTAIVGNLIAQANS